MKTNILKNLMRLKIVLAFTLLGVASSFAQGLSAGSASTGSSGVIANPMGQTPVAGNFMNMRLPLSWEACLDLALVLESEAKTMSAFAKSSRCLAHGCRDLLLCVWVTASPVTTKRMTMAKRVKLKTRILASI